MLLRACVIFVVYFFNILFLHFYISFLQVNSFLSNEQIKQFITSTVLPHHRLLTSQQSVS